MPGLFETHSSLYDPRDPESSFQNWLAAARRTLDSGARAILGQVLAAPLEDFRPRQHYGHDESDKNLIRSFGGSSSSFVGNSVGIKGLRPTIVCCYGLPSKIVRGDSDLSLLTALPFDEFRAVNLNHNYSFSSDADVDQGSIDLITLQEPTKTTQLPISFPDYRSYRLSEKGVSVPFRSILRDRFEFHPKQLLNLIHYLVEGKGKQIEIEGLVDVQGISLVQLREYDLPIRDFTQLTQVPPTKIIHQNKASMGYHQFKGDLYVADHFPDNLPDDAIFMYTKDLNGKDLERLAQHKQVVIPPFYLEKDKPGSQIATHVFGYNTQMLVILQSLGTDAIVMGGIDEVFLTPYAKRKFRARNVGTDDKPVLKYQNITVECDGESSQVYLNK